MTTHKATEPHRIAEEWGSWEDAERASHAAFQRRTPRDRLAWLEDLIKLRYAALAATQQPSTS